MHNMSLTITGFEFEFTSEAGSGTDYLLYLFDKQSGTFVNQIMICTY